MCDGLSGEIGELGEKGEKGEKRIKWGEKGAFPTFPGKGLNNRRLLNRNS